MANVSAAIVDGRLKVHVDLQKGDLPGHPFRGNQWSVGGGGVSVDPKRIDGLSLEENRAEMRGLVEKYRSDDVYRQASDVVAMYSSSSQSQGLATRGIVERALVGKTRDEIASDPKVQKLLTDAGWGDKELDALVSSAAGYYSTVRDAAPTTDTVYRGAKGSPKGEEFELRGPTAFSHSLDSAMTYAGGTLYEVVPGAKMLPVRAMSNARNAANSGGDEEKYATVPAFYERSNRSVHPLGMSHGFAIDFDGDRELSSAGRYKVLGEEKRSVTYEDQVTGRKKTKTVKVIKVQHVGVF